MSGPGPTLRWDPVTARHVLVAPHRRATPRDVVHRTERVRSAEECPFCPGAEGRTAPPVAEVLDASGRWCARSFPNLYPMTVDDPALPAPPRVPWVDAPNGGAHEVIVETPEHDRDLAQLDDAQGRVVVALYRDRLRALDARPGAAVSLLFKNRGPRAGGSLAHPHAQALSLPVVPSGVARRDRVARKHFLATGVSPVVAQREAELAHGQRLVERTEHFAVLCPWAPSRSYEVWIVPRFASPWLGDLPDAHLDALSIALRRTLLRVRAVTSDADYNLVLRGPAKRNRGAPWATWHIEVHPRRGGDAGFELSAGMSVVVTSPEEAAEALRGVAR